MNKLNRKGFTLVELLAVIVILAIVVGITLVTVLPTLKKARQEAFETTAQTAAAYLEDQYELTLVGSLSGATLEMTTIPTSKTAMKDEDYKRAGLKPENYASGTWFINQSTGRACVVLEANTKEYAEKNGKEPGEFYDANPATVRSTGC